MLVTTGNIVTDEYQLKLKITQAENKITSPFRQRGGVIIKDLSLFMIKLIFSQ